jgi:hypothetical protein
MAILIILSIRVMIRNIQLLNRLGVLSNDAVTPAKKAYERLKRR